MSESMSHRYLDNYPKTRALLMMSSMVSLVTLLPFICAIYISDYVDKSNLDESSVKNMLLTVSGYFALASSLILNSTIVNGLIFGGIGCAFSSSYDKTFAISFAASMAFAITTLAISLCLSQVKQQGLEAKTESAMILLGATTPVGLAFAAGGVIADNC